MVDHVCARLATYIADTIAIPAKKEETAQPNEKKRRVSDLLLFVLHSNKTIRTDCSRPDRFVAERRWLECHPPMRQWQALAGDYHFRWFSSRSVWVVADQLSFWWAMTTPLPIVCRVRLYTVLSIARVVVAGFASWWYREQKHKEGFWMQRMLFLVARTNHVTKARANPGRQTIESSPGRHSAYWLYGVWYRV